MVVGDEVNPTFAVGLVVRLENTPSGVPLLYLKDEYAIL